MRTIITAIILLVMSTCASAQTKSFHDQLNGLFYSVLNELEHLARTNGDPQIAKLMRHPTVSIDWNSKVPGATATHGNGFASISVSVEMIKLMYFFAELSALGIDAPSTTTEKLVSCKTEYTNHIKDQIFHVFSGGNPNGAYSTYDSPEEFARISHQCNGVDKIYPMTDNQNQIRNNLVGNGIAFVVMHEIGHIIIGHKLSPSGNEIRRSILCASRRNESEADEFAVKKLVGYGSLVAVTNNAYWDVGLTSGSIIPSRETRSTHPSPSRRMSKSINLAIREWRRAGLKVDPRLVNLTKQLVELQTTIENVLADESKFKTNVC